MAAKTIERKLYRKEKHILNEYRLQNMRWSPRVWSCLARCGAPLAIEDWIAICSSSTNINTDWKQQAFRGTCRAQVQYANAFRTGSSNLSFTKKSCACASVSFLAGIISCSMDYTCNNNFPGGGRGSCTFISETVLTKNRSAFIRVTFKIQLCWIKANRNQISGCGFVSHDVLQSGMWSPKFRSNRLPPSSTWNWI
jgi:hypothetical protein